jgi:hypothetical protein
MKSSLTKDDIIIRILAREEACIVIIGITVSPRAVVLEVVSRRAALADICIVELTTAAILIGTVSEARTLARDNIIAARHLQVPWASWVQVLAAGSCGTSVLTVRLSACGLYLHRMLRSV